MGGRLLEWVGGCVSGEGSPDDHEQPQTEGCWAHGGAQQPLPRTQPCLPVCSFSPKCPLPSLLPLCHRGRGFMPQILPKCPEGTARRVGGSCLPPAPSHPGGSEGAPVTCQPGHCDAARGPEVQPTSQGRGSPKPGGSSVPVCPSVPSLSVAHSTPWSCSCPPCTPSPVMEPLRLFPLLFSPGSIWLMSHCAHLRRDTPTLTVPWLIHVDAWQKPTQYCEGLSFN